MRKEIIIIQQTAINLGFDFNETDAYEMWIELKKEVYRPKIERHHVCDRCMSVDLVDPNCKCVGGGMFNEYGTIELEFEVCKSCGCINDNCADTEFNKNKLNNI